MLDPLRDLDRVLRGEATRPSALRGTGTVPIQAGRLVPLLLVLGAVYGAFMGLYALMNRSDPEPMQLVAAVVKVPALFMLTLLVTFPSLYVFNALVGSRLTPVSLMRMLIASLGVTLAVLSSLGPIVGFFSLTSENYPFMIVFNVVVFATSGVLGLVFLARTLSRLSIVDEVRTPATPAPEASAVSVVAVEDLTAGPLDGDGPVLGPHVKKVFGVWMLVFGLVGAQMAWVLRPFIGNPNQPFTWFRPRESSFFEAVFSAIKNLFS
jgi:hypothetical protein